MRRCDKFTVEICMERDGEVLPYLSIGADGAVEWHVSEEKRKACERDMLTNMSEGMSRFYSAHPELL